jgi:hypothetical protein
MATEIEPQRFERLEGRVRNLESLVEALSSRSLEGESGSVKELDHRLEERFVTLASEWKVGRGYTSSISKMCSHPAYQQIVGMGDKAIPLILRELEQAPDHWFWALKAITGVNPVPQEERADIKAMARYWLEWGREEGYRW